MNHNKPNKSTMNIKLHITLQTPPADLDFALQKGPGSISHPVQKQRSQGQDLFFELTVKLKGDSQKDDLPDFKGDFVQGPLKGRFIYINIGASAGQAGVSNWRLKIPLGGITWETIDKLNADPNAAMETAVPGTGRNGAPNCATVKPFDGWHFRV